MLHNIPEGLVISIAAYKATKSWERPVGLALTATLAEVLAGFIAWQVILAIDSQSTDNKEIVWMQAVLSSIASGIMAQASLGSLLPHCLQLSREALAVSATGVNGRSSTTNPLKHNDPDPGAIQEPIQISGISAPPEHTPEPTRLLSISYAVFCLKKKKKNIE
eukprot:TRINITY_DN6194_c0_g1_i8.p2 TRINITY_DN6194_c0_g1~~TRINITY_DN6194_c0_g1_i8.p2  ORF type:complete len:163 (+),score=39.01 TRINITY_DN6194_c0_g1_i8:718-1206(+)